MEERNKIIKISVLLLGLGLTVYLVLNFQTILSRAGSNDYSNFRVTKVQGGTEQEIICSPASDGSVSCDTDSLDIKLQVKDLEKLNE